MTFANPIFDQLIVGRYPGGPYVLIEGDANDAVARIVFGSGQGAELQPGVIENRAIALAITPNESASGRRLILDATEVILGNDLDPPGGGSPLDLLDPSRGCWSSGAAQAITTTTVTTITDYSTVIGAAPKDVDVTAGVITPLRGGRWRFGLQGRFAADATVTGVRLAYARSVAGVDEEVWDAATPIGTQPSVCSAWWEDDYNGTTDTFRWRVFQNRGSNLNWRTQRVTAECVRPDAA